MKWNKAGWFAMGLIFCAAWASNLWAQDEDRGKRDLIKSRTYIGIIGTSSTIDQWGDFQGTGGLQSASSSVSAFSEVDYIPAITRNFGWGFLLGYREGPWAAELSFSRTDHTAVIYFSGPVTFKTPANYSAINFDFKRYFFTVSPVQPFVSMGMSFPWLWVRQGSYLYTDSTLTTQISSADETISGIGLNLGAGVEIYLNQDISLVGGAFQRWTGFDQISGASKIPFDQMYFDNNPSDVGALEGDGLNIYVGTTFGFQM